MKQSTLVNVLEQKPETRTGVTIKTVEEQKPETRTGVTIKKYPQREGTLNIPVNEDIKLKICQWYPNKYGKLQFSGYANIPEKEVENGRYVWIPTHQLLTCVLNQIRKINIVDKGVTKFIKEPEVIIKRLNEGGLDKQDGQKKIGYRITIDITEDMFE